MVYTPGVDTNTVTGEAAASVVALPGLVVIRNILGGAFTAVQETRTVKTPVSSAITSAGDSPGEHEILAMFVGQIAICAPTLTCPSDFG